MLLFSSETFVILFTLQHVQIRILYKTSAIFLKKIGSRAHRVAQNSVGEGEALNYIDSREEGSRMPFHLASF
jgi:hypothetical protein